MKINTERRITVIKTPSMVNTFFMPIPSIHGPIAKTNAVATMLRETVMVTIESATI
jgi:exopolysaccharide biosynthesis predicted pyruvyltransferase EpsI